MDKKTEGIRMVKKQKQAKPESTLLICERKDMDEMGEILELSCTKFIQIEDTVDSEEKTKKIEE